MIMQRPQMEQWCARAGLKFLHLWHSRAHPSGVVGRASGGTAPGFESIVRAWHTMASTAQPLKSTKFAKPEKLVSTPSQGEIT